MAALLKDSFGPDVARRIGGMIAAAHPDFDRDAFVAVALDGYEDLELTPRARQIAAALSRFLPDECGAALEILTASLGPPIAGDELTGMASFVYLPHVYYVAEHGLGCFEASMRAQYELTRRFTAEFSIRAFLERHERETLARLRMWATDPDPHVRRLVSEGTRPRLPWAPRLRRFQEDPTAVLDLLDLLKDDPSEYVRRSVANNLNDIAKDNPDRVITVARDWFATGGADRRRLVRHGLRTLIKQAHPEALEVLGYTSSSPVAIANVGLSPAVVRIGGKVQVTIAVINPSDDRAGALVDLRVHFVKASGATSPKVFKGAELTLDPGATATVRKTISVAQHTTRTHHPGTHRIEVQLNGITHPAGAFEVIG